MNEIIFALTMFCPTPVIENRTKFPWNENDKWNLDSALPKCAKLYPKSPCLKKFIKSGERDYQVVCSKGRA